jgi:hypothetical protein
MHQLSTWTPPWLIHISYHNQKAQTNSFHQYSIGKFHLPNKAKGSTPKTPGGPKGVRHPNRVETFASINFHFPNHSKIPKSVRLFRPLINPESPDAGTEDPHNIKFKTCAFL